jgi:hypothetical protein
VKGEYQPPSFGYSSSQQFQPADTHREIPSTEAFDPAPEAPEAPEAPMHETSDILEQVAEEPPVQTREEGVEEKGKGKEVTEFIPPYTAWNPAR